MRTDPYDDLCLLCGYDLRGLKMPHACPECGEVRDPELDEKNARDWFAKRGLRLLWPVKLLRCPTGIWYLLSDRSSQQLAKRRHFVWLWLPAILTIFVVCPTAFLGIEYQVHGWYYQRNDPKRAVLATYDITEREHLFGIEFHFMRDPYFFLRSANWVEVIERKFNRVVLTPDEVDLASYALGTVPPVGVLLGFYSTHFLVFMLASRNSRELSFDRQPVRAVSAVLAPTLGLSLWAWFAMLMGWALCKVFSESWLNSAFTHYLVVSVVGLSLGNWILTCLFGWYLLLTMDHARLVVRRRLLVALLLLGTSVGLPCAVLMVLRALL